MIILSLGFMISFNSIYKKKKVGLGNIL